MLRYTISTAYGEASLSLLPICVPVLQFRLSRQFGSVNYDNSGHECESTKLLRPPRSLALQWTLSLRSIACSFVSAIANSAIILPIARVLRFNSDSTARAALADNAFCEVSGKVRAKSDSRFRSSSPFDLTTY